MLPEHLAKALEAGVDPIDVIQGHIKNLMVALQDVVGDFSEGYNEALTDLYTLCYDVIFYKSDLEAM
jgi:hypothetical protein